jgi:hypothetical protein
VQLVAVPTFCCWDWQVHAHNLLHACKLLDCFAATAVIQERMITLLRLIDASANLLANELGAFPVGPWRHQEEQFVSASRCYGTCQFWQIMPLLDVDSPP